MTEVNFARNQARWDNFEGISEQDCRRLGAEHGFYGWAYRLDVRWPDSYRAAYLAGYDEGADQRRDQSD